MKVDILNTDRRYQIIYADPPWAFKTYSDKGKEHKSAECHYHCMNIQDIYNLPVQKIANINSVLLIWVTMPMLQQGIETIKQWGFTYKTCAFTWIKQNINADSKFMGCGYYTRANAELCLLATKGKILNRESHSVRQIIESKIREHSRKPDEARDRIVELFGNLPRIELFARQNVAGWDCWGNEAPEIKMTNKKENIND